MLLVPTLVKESPIHGLGLFAAVDVAAGEAVWRFSEGFDVEADVRVLDGLPGPQRAWLEHFGYVDRWLGRFILCVDDYRYLNHSDAPNLESVRGEARHGVDRARRAICAGEELTIDYRSFEAPAPGSGPLT